MVTISAYEDCPVCHGDGVVYDWVPIPFGSGNCRMLSGCDDCLGQAIIDGLIDAEYDGDIEIVPFDWRG